MSTNPPNPGPASARSQSSPPPHPSRGPGAVKFALLLVVLIAAGWAVTHRGANSDEAQHVIIILVDTTRRDSFGCYGARRPVTPRMDQIAAEGVRFDQAIAQSCWTLPAVTSVLTSTYVNIHGSQ